MQKLIGIYGASGFGSEVIPLVKTQFPQADLCFIDDGYDSDRFMGYRVFSFDGFIASEGLEKSVVIAIANSKVREILHEKCVQSKIEILDVKADTSVTLENVELGTGSILCNFTHLTSNIKIGKQFHANIYSYVAHDCVIGDFVTFAPRVHCNGNVHIEDHAYIGTGAIIKQGTPERPLVIGAGAVVGMGAVVTKSVAPGVTVIGNPARPLTRDALRK